MKIDIGFLREKILYSYASYKKQVDNPLTGVDWLENILDGVYTQREGDNFYIVFRGTDPNKKSSAVNTRLAKKRIPYPGTNPAIKVHTGFIDLYDTPACRAVINERVHQALLENSNTVVWVLGHSQGASISMLCALDLQYQFNLPWNRLICVPFSPARVGNSAFVRSYNRRVPSTFCLKVGHDLVPRIPLVIMGFRHAGHLIHINPRNIFQILGNYVVGAVKMLIHWRPWIYVKYSPPMPENCSSAKGSDWYLFDDHSPLGYPKFVLDTFDLKHYVSIRKH